MTPNPTLRRAVLALAALGVVGVGVVALVFQRDLRVAYHVWRLESEPELIEEYFVVNPLSLEIDTSSIEHAALRRLGKIDEGRGVLATGFVALVMGGDWRLQLDRWFERLDWRALDDSSGTAERRAQLRAALSVLVEAECKQEVLRGCSYSLCILRGPPDFSAKWIGLEPAAVVVRSSEQVAAVLAKHRDDPRSLFLLTPREPSGALDEAPRR